MDSSMDTNSSMRELPELGAEDYPSLFNLWHVNSVDELSSILPKTAAFRENFQVSFSNNYPTSGLKSCVGTSHSTAIDRPSELQIDQTNSWNSCQTDMADTSNLQSGFSPNSFSFSGSNHMINNNPMDILKPQEESACTKSMEKFPSNMNILPSQTPAGSHKRVSTSNRISQTYDHITAERKRRENLSQKFIALSAIVPGLKKVDKASVLGDAIKYLKQLQEKVKTLEEQTKKKSMESVVFVKKSQIFADNLFLDNINLSDPFDEPLPEIEARICDKSVLIRIHTEKRKLLAEKIMSEIEKCHLTIINSNVMSFGSSALDITIVALMDMQFCMTVKDLVRKLGATLKSLI